MALRSGILASRLGVVGCWMLCSNDGLLERASRAHCRGSPQSSLELVSAHVFVSPGTRTPLRRVVDPSGILGEWYAADTNKEGLGLLPLQLVWLDSDSNKKAVEKNSLAATMKHGGNALLGELTREGLVQARGLGEKLHKRFTELFASNFSWTVIASSRCETLDTAHGVASGLSSRAGSSAAEVKVFGPKQEDWLAFPNTNLRTCPRLVNLFSSSLQASDDQLRQTQTGTNVLSIFEAKYGLKHPGSSSGSLSTTADFFQVFRDQVVCASRKPKQIVSSQLEAQLNRLAAEQMFQVITGGSEENRTTSTRLVVGRLIKHLTEEFESMRIQRTVQVYACEDRTMMALMACIDPFGASDCESTRSWPKSCAALTFEVWQDRNSKRYIRITIDETPLHIPGLPAVSRNASFYSAAAAVRYFQKFTLQADTTELCM